MPRPQPRPAQLYLPIYISGRAASKSAAQCPPGHYTSSAGGGSAGRSRRALTDTRAVMSGVKRHYSSVNFLWSVFAPDGRGARAANAAVNEGWGRRAVCIQEALLTLGGGEASGAGRCSGGRRSWPWWDGAARAQRRVRTGRGAPVTPRCGSPTHTHTALAWVLLHHKTCQIHGI